MLVHLYVFLSTVFIGMQGVALYRAQIKNLSQEEIVYVSKPDNLNITLGDVAPLWVDAAPKIEKNSFEIIKTPEEINDSLKKDIEDMVVLRDQTWDRKHDVIEEEIADEESTNVIEEEIPQVVAQVNVENENNLEESDIKVYDYGQDKNEVKVANAIVKETRPKNEIEKYINEVKNNVKPENQISQSVKSFDAKAEFIINGEISKFNNLEVFSIFGVENVPFDNTGKGELKKTISGNETSEIFEVNYPQMMPVQVNVLWKKDDVDNVEIPLVEQSRISEMYEYFNLKGEFGLVLVKLKKDFDYYELENSKDMVFLDSILEETDEENAVYVLYLGVTPGNKDLIFKVGENAITQNLHVVQNTISFVDIETELGTNKVFSLYESLPLSKLPRDLILQSEDFSVISNNGFVEKTGLNSFLYNSKESIRTEKDLVQIKNSDQDYFVDMKKIDSKIVLPSREYINQVLDTVENENTSCIIDISFNKKIELIETKFFAEVEEKINGKSFMVSKEESVTERYLDKDGIFYTSVSDNSERLFVLSEFNGVAFVKIQYKDGSQQIEKYLCGDRVYHLDSVGD